MDHPKFITLNNSALTGVVAENADGDSQRIVLQTPLLDLTENSRILAETFSTGNAGRIRIQDAETVSLDDSSISTTINRGAVTEQPSSIRIDTQFFSLNNSSEVTAETRGTGDAGDIVLSDVDLVELNDSSISTETRRDGNAGNIRILGAEEVTLNNSSITAAIRSTGEASQPSNIRIDAQNISLANDSEITAETEGRGTAGDIILPNIDVVELNDSSVATETSSRGSAGNIQIRGADEIALEDNSSISTAANQGAIAQDPSNIDIETQLLSLENNSEITAETQGRVEAGDVTIRADELNIESASQILTTTSSRENAGDITIEVENDALITDRDSGIFANTRRSTDGGNIEFVVGDDLTLSDRARISAQAQRDGQAGEINIQVEDSLDLSNRAQISTQSQTNRAGDISINVGDRFSATNSDITTSAEEASGGSIALQAADIRLFGDSDIRTNSGESGGNINLSANSIIAFDDSDILAFANEIGGDITLDTPSFFGENFSQTSLEADPTDLDGNNRVDVNATGAVSGTVELPDLSFLQNSLANLTQTAIDADTLLANSCVTRTADGSTFLVTGSGGLPERPGDAPTSEYPNGDIRVIPSGDASKKHQQSTHVTYFCKSDRQNKHQT